MAYRKSNYWLSFVFLFALISSVADAAPISGTISLPGGQLASGTMLFAISATDTSGGQPFQFTNVSIAAGTSSVAFSLGAVPDEPSSTWRIRYSCFDNFDGCLDYVLVGYYDTGSAGNVNYKESEATTVSQGQSEVNFEVLEGIEFSGSLTSPAGNAPAGGIDVQMFFTSVDFSVSEGVFYEIAEGESSVNFSVMMPEDASLDYRVRYSCDTRPAASDNCTDLF